MLDERKAGESAGPKKKKVTRSKKRRGRKLRALRTIFELTFEGRKAYMFQEAPRPRVADTARNLLKLPLEERLAGESAGLSLEIFEVTI